MTRRNTPQLWDELWEQQAPPEKDVYRVRKEERLIRWRRIEDLVTRRLGGFDGLSVIEIGAGTGTYAALMARRGARVTVLDYSPIALERAERLFSRLGIPAEFVEADALNPTDELAGQHDLSMSFGLAEHFTGETRTRIFGAHLDLVRPGGLAVVSVPNRANPPYRLHKWMAERTGAWKVGEEYPFSRDELERIARSLGVETFGFFGDSLWRSKRFLNPIKWFPRKRRSKGAAAPAAGAAEAAAASSSSDRKWRGRRLPGVERGTPWDERWAYALVLWAERPASYADGGAP